MNTLHKTIILGLAILCGQTHAQLLEQVDYIHGKLGDNDAFYSAEGWDREPLAAHLNFPPEMAGDLFPESDPELSVTAEIDGIAIGQRKCNWWKKDLLETFPIKLKNALEKHGHDQRFAKYAATIETVCYKGTIPLIDLFTSMNIPLESIAHNNGLIVLKKYAGQGIGNNLQAESIRMLREKGIRAIVTTTTNSFSARVMERNGFIRFKDFSYADDLDLPGLPGYFTVWYLILIPVT